jgi:hypothetical protein
MQTTRIPPITIETKKYEKLKLVLQEEEKTVSQLVRELIDIYFYKKMSKSKGKSLPEIIEDNYSFESKKKLVDSSNYKGYLYK